MAYPVVVNNSIAAGGRHSPVQSPHIKVIDANRIQLQSQWRPIAPLCFF